MLQIVCWAHITHDAQLQHGMVFNPGPDLTFGTTVAGDVLHKASTIVRAVWQSMTWACPAGLAGWKWL